MPTRGGKRMVEQAAARPRARDIPARCREATVDLVRFLYCGNDSVIRGKASHTRFLNSLMRSGIGLTVAMQSFNMLDQLLPGASFGPVGEIRLMPDRERFARLLCAMHTLAGAPWDACPRSFLKRMIGRAREAGLTFQASFENEFTLARRD